MDLLASPHPPSGFGSLPSTSGGCDPVSPATLPTFMPNTPSPLSLTTTEPPLQNSTPVRQITLAPTTPTPINAPLTSGPFEFRYGPARARVPNSFYFPEHTPAPKPNLQPVTREIPPPPKLPQTAKKNKAQASTAKQYPHALHNFLLQHISTLAPEQAATVMSVFYNECGHPLFPPEQSLDFLPGRLNVNPNPLDEAGLVHSDCNPQDHQMDMDTSKAEGLVNPSNTQKGVSDMFSEGGAQSTARELRSARANIGFPPAPFSHTFPNGKISGGPKFTPGSQALRDAEIGIESLRQLRSSGWCQQLPSTENVLNNPPLNFNKPKNTEHAPPVRRRGRPRKIQPHINLHISSNREGEKSIHNQEQAPETPQNKFKLTMKQGQIMGSVASPSKAPGSTLTGKAKNAVHAPAGKSLSSLRVIFSRTKSAQEALCEDSDVDMDADFSESTYETAESEVHASDEDSSWDDLSDENETNPKGHLGADSDSDFQDPDIQVKKKSRK